MGLSFWDWIGLALGSWPFVATAVGLTLGRFMKSDDMQEIEDYANAGGAR